MDKQNFTSTPYVKKVDKPWGHEIIFTEDHKPYTGKIMVVNAGKRWSLHYHEEKLESLCLVSGKMNIFLENPAGDMEMFSMELHKGYTVTPGQKHRLEAVEDSIVVEASLPETGTTVRVEDDFARSDETNELRASDPNRGWKA